MMSHPLISIIAGFVLWSVLFLLFYGVQATGCYLAWDRTGVIGSLSAHRLVLTGLLLLSVGFSLILFLKMRGRHAGRSSSEPAKDFARDVGHYVWLAALFAMPFCFGGVVWLTLCAN